MTEFYARLKFLLMMLVISFTGVLLSVYHAWEGNRKMTENTIIILTAAASFISLFAVTIGQIIFYRKDSQTMSDIKNDVSSGNSRLQDRMEHKHELLANEHADIEKIVREIRTRQEQELKLQEKIKDTVPDAEILKEGITKICMENAQLKEQITEMRNEIQQLKETNRKLVKNLKREKNMSQGMER